MQFLSVPSDMTLQDLSNIAGKRNAEEILVANRLSRTRDVGKKFEALCNEAQQQSTDATSKEKITILNTLTGDDDVFEAASLLGENGWRVLKTLNTLPGYLRIPETIDPLTDSTAILGGKSTSVTTIIYNKVMNSLKYSGTIDPQIFNEYSSSASVNLSRTGQEVGRQDAFNGFIIPWGKIQLYSSLSDSVVDFPVYPEEVSEEYTANYTTMPDLIYQYEPWYTYESSGPRNQEYTFHIHRDMWSGNHLDGKANQLVRFCQANCYPRYNGSAVYSSTVKMYINGATHISGILTNVRPQWTGPIGRDGWYLELNLSLTITEVSDIPLNYDSVMSMNIIGGR